MVKFLLSCKILINIFLQFVYNLLRYYLSTSQMCPVIYLEISIDKWIFRIILEFMVRVRCAVKFTDLDLTIYSFSHTQLLVELCKQGCSWSCYWCCCWSCPLHSPRLHTSRPSPGLCARHLKTEKNEDFILMSIYFPHNCSPPSRSGANYEMKFT